FQRNVELYPGSANVYDSLGEGLEAAGKLDSATKNFQKAIEIGAKNNDGALPEFKKHLDRVTADSNAATSKSAQSAQTLSSQLFAMDQFPGRRRLGTDEPTDGGIATQLWRRGLKDVARRS